VDRRELDRANGRLYGMEMVMNQFVGPPLGGVLAGAAIALAFTGSALAYLLAFVALLLIKGSFRPSREGEVPARMRTDIAEGVRYLLGHRLLRTMAFMVGVMNLCTSAVFGLLPLYAVDPGPMGLSETGYGIFLTSMALGSVVGGWTAGWMVRVLGRSRLLFLSVLTTAGMLAAPLATEPWIVAVLLFVTGTGFMGWNVVTVSLRQRIVPERLLGRLNASYRLVAWGTMPVGAALGGVLAEVFGLRSVFVVTAVIALGLVFCMPQLTNAKLDAAEAEAEPPAADPGPAEEAPVTTP
jgi:Transmembrane secretion effector